MLSAVYAGSNLFARNTVPLPRLALKPEANFEMNKTDSFTVRFGGKEEPHDGIRRVLHGLEQPPRVGLDSVRTQLAGGNEELARNLADNLLAHNIHARLKPLEPGEYPELALIPLDKKGDPMPFEINRLSGEMDTELQHTFHIFRIEQDAHHPSDEPKITSVYSTGTSVSVLSKAPLRTTSGPVDLDYVFETARQFDKWFERELPLALEQAYPDAEERRDAAERLSRA